MEIPGKVIWQIAAGNGKTTHYARECLQKDVVLLGPGRFGPWPECDKPLREHTTLMKKSLVQQFARDIMPGQLVVLRVGTQHVYGVGQVVGEYGYSEQFADVQGWDVQHYRRVRWLWHRDGEPHVFPVPTLMFGSSVQRLDSTRAKTWLRTLDIPPEAYTRPLHEL